MYTALSIDSTLLLSSIFIQNQHQEWFSQHRSIDHPTMYSMVNNSLARYASWPPYSPLELLTHQSIYDSFPFQTPILQTIFHLPPTRSALHTNESIYLSSFSTPFLNIIQCSEELYISICILFFLFLWSCSWRRMLLHSSWFIVSFRPRIHPFFCIDWEWILSLVFKKRKLSSFLFSIVIIATTSTTWLSLSCSSSSLWNTDSESIETLNFITSFHHFILKSTWCWSNQLLYLLFHSFLFISLSIFYCLWFKRTETKQVETTTNFFLDHRSFGSRIESLYNYDYIWWVLWIIQFCLFHFPVLYSHRSGSKLHLSLCNSFSTISIFLDSTMFDYYSSITIKLFLLSHYKSILSDLLFEPFCDSLSVYLLLGKV